MVFPYIDDQCSYKFQTNPFPLPIHGIRVTCKQDSVSDAKAIRFNYQVQGYRWTTKIFFRIATPISSKKSFPEKQAKNIFQFFELYFLQKSLFLAIVKLLQSMIDILLKMSLYLHFHLISLDTIANDWNRTADLSCQKHPLLQMCLSQCSSSVQSKLLQYS